MSNKFHDDRDPAVSVLLPVYNAERYLGEAVESVLVQTFRDFELLALDDGSTDGSLRILRHFEARDNRIRVLPRRNRGLVAALNELIDKGRGRFLARMDADDICRPQRFERQVDYLHAHPECVALGSRVLLIDPEGMPVCEFIDELSHDEIDSAHLSGSHASRICHPAVMMRREAVIGAGQYRREYLFAEDLDLFLRLAEGHGKLANLPQVLLEYRLHHQAIGHTRGFEQRNVARAAMKMAHKRRGMTTAFDMSEPVKGRQTSADAHRKWAWWALSAGNVTTARKHAIKALAKGGPFNMDNLRVVACAIRGH